MKKHLSIFLTLILVLSAAFAYLFVAAPKAKAAPNFVKATDCPYQGSGTTYSCNITATAGDFLFITNTDNNTSYVSSIGDSKSNFYSLITAANRGGITTVSILYGIVTTGGSLTVNATSTGTIQWMPIIAEFSGVTTVSPIIQTVTGGGGANPISTTNFSSVPSGSLIVGGAGNYYASGTWSAGNPSGMVIPANGVNNEGSDDTSNSAIEWVTLSSSYSSSATITWSGTVYSIFLAIAVASSGGGGATTGTVANMSIYPTGDVNINQSGNLTITNNH